MMVRMRRPTSTVFPQRRHPALVRLGLSAAVGMGENGIGGDLYLVIT